LFELFGEQPVVPRRVFGQPVIGDHEGPRLGLAKMLELNSRHPVPAEQLASPDAAVTGQHSEVSVHQHRDIEAESFDTTRDLSDLSWAVNARVIGVQLQLVQRSVDDADAAFSLV